MGSKVVEALLEGGRALLAMTLLTITGILAAYGMHIGWTVTDVLSPLAFFGPLDTAAITYYFAARQAETLRNVSENERKEE